jgi:hypothetical protein
MRRHRQGVWKANTFLIKQGYFAPYFRVGRRVYYRRCVLEEWIARQEQQAGDHRD